MWSPHYNLCAGQNGQKFSKIRTQNSHLLEKNTKNELRVQIFAPKKGILKDNSGMKSMNLPTRQEVIFLETKSKKMEEIYGMVKSVAPTRSTVLITGESGTGKSFLAKMIHELSNRSTMPYVGVHCGAIPEGLAESELFGHEKGSFTGAHRDKLGKFELAHGGTIFLDEIGTVNASIQIKLLQALQEKTLQKVGSEKSQKVDVRVIAASNINFDELVKKGEFREDLFYRLNVFPIEMPSLRERKEDIPDLANFFLLKYGKEMGKPIESFTDEAMEALKSYSWPGNIRELENVIERAFILESSPYLTLDSLPMSVSEGARVISVPIVQKNTGLSSLSEARKSALEVLERNYLAEVLSETKGKINKSAEIAGVTPRQLHKLLNKYQISRKDFT